MTAARLNSPGDISAFGQAEAAAAATLNSSIMAWAGDVMADGTGARLQATLDALARGDADDGVLAQTQGGAARGEERLLALRTLQDQIAPLRDRISLLLGVLHQATTAPEQQFDRLDDSARRDLLAAKAAHLEGLLGNLDRCQLVTARLLSSEHAAQDQLDLARDVTAPVAVRETCFAHLAAAGDASRALSHQIDEYSTALLETGFVAPAPRPPIGAALFARLMRRRDV